MQEIVLLMGEKVEGIGKINFVTPKKGRRASDTVTSSEFTDCDYC